MENANDNNIPSVIKRVRKGQKLSQRVFAEKLGVNIKTVQNWEYKGSSPTRTNIQTVIDTFKLKEEDYPELFEYIAHPRPYGEAESAKAEKSATTEVAAEEAAKEETPEDEKKPFLKRVLNVSVPVKMIIFSVIALIIAVGVFFMLFLTLQNGYDLVASIIVSLVAAVASGIAVTLMAHLLPIGKAFIFSFATVAAIGVFMAVASTHQFSCDAWTIISSAFAAVATAATIVLVYFLVVWMREK